MKKYFIKIQIFLILILIIIVTSACGVPRENVSDEMTYPPVAAETATPDAATQENRQTGDPGPTVISEKTPDETANIPDDVLNDITENGKYKLIEVDGGDTNGNREPMVVVDVGYGDREYWAYTNEYGQLFRVIAKKIILQDDEKEQVNKDGRYYDEEAFVPGTERPDLDQGHVIADSLGGVSNAYNITPQNSALNRYGNQAYMEKVIRDAGGCTDFEALIFYPDNETQIPSRYKYTYKIFGETIVDEFDNVDPDKVNNPIIDKEKESMSTGNEIHDISSIDTNGNGIVSIAEAKAAGFKMPITKDHWLYQYMIDGDGDGMVGE